jgi:Undecaprenyl-phosphate galactose phosphotransferase WbaP
MWVDEKDIGGVLGMELRRTGLKRPPNILKRAFDLVLGTLIGIVLLPLLAVIYLSVRLSSRGPALYCGTRIGLHGRPFAIWKFRSMVQDAEEVLQQHLDSHPDLLNEWLTNHKLRNDPRITTIGKFLRRTSLDELPQIWNIIRGDMSFIGPRPIAEQEISRYSDNYLLYKTVRPGLTGLWQISGRNDTSYEERVKYDEYYVRNWSMWLDLYILGKTAHVVLASKGAY